MTDDRGAAETPGAAGITVTGEGTASAPPDVFVVEVAAEMTAPTPGRAFEAAAAGLQAIADEALAAGVSSEDLRSGAMSLSTGYDREGQPSGFRAELTLEIRVRDLAAAGPTLARLVDAGSESARVRGTRFEHSDPATLGAEARDAAFADAQQLAHRYAELAQRPLGPVVRVADAPGGRDPGPRPVAALMARDAGGPPVQAGSLAVTARVTVSWAWG